MSAKLQSVHVRVNDAATGKPTSCRLRVTDAAGNYHAPFGRLADFTTAPGLGVGGNVSIDNEAWAYIDGACEIALPPGEIRVRVRKGPEHRPIDETMALIAGKLSMRLTIERWADLRAEGWFSGDARAHHLSAAAALLEAQAEDLAVVNLLITDGHIAAERWLANILEFSGQGPAAQSAGHLVAVNSYNRAPMGALGLLNTHRVVHPLTVESIDWTLADWCGQCHRKGGLVVWSRFEDDGAADHVSEGLANLLLGDVDAIEATDAACGRAGHPDWYSLLNCGLRVPIVGASGKESNGMPLGRTRTYARLGRGADLDYRHWIEAVRAGRTFVSDGPLLSFSVEGQEAGAMVDLAAGQERVKARAAARSLEEIERVQVVLGGEVIAEAAGVGSEAVLETEIALEESAWLAARCSSKGGAAHTSPIYVRRPERPFRPRSQALDHVERWLSRYPAMLNRFDREKRFASARDRARLEKVYEAALEKLKR